MKKTLILHVGMGKTGTTAIQNALWDNRKVLARHGITYPTVGAVSKAHHLISPRCPPFLSHTGWRFLEVEEWVPAAKAAKTDTLVMSSELISWSEPDQITAFCSALRDHFDVKACLYLRRQDNSVMAGYNQMIKAGTQVAPIDRVIERQLDRYDYLAKIWPWERGLGAENLIIRPYEREQFHKGDLIDDFLLRILGIERPEGFETSTDRNPNPRLSRGAMEYKRFINILIPEPEVSERFNPAIEHHSQSTDSSSAAIFHEHDLLSPEQRELVMRVHGPGNAYIARKFLGREDGGLFLDTVIPDTPRQQADLDLMPEFRALSERLARDEPKLLAQLQAAMASALATKPHRQPIQLAVRTLQASFDPPAPPASRTAQPPLETPASPPAHPSRPQAQSQSQSQSQSQKKSIFVHFGIRTTDTSSIQNTLFSARNSLPDTTYLSKGATARSSSVIRNAFLAEARLASLVGPDGESDNLRQTGLREFKNMNAQASKSMRGILSAEAISDLDAAQLEQMNKILADYWSDITYIGYIRDPATHARLVFQSRLENSIGRGFSFTRPADLKFNYHLIVQRLDALVGREAVKVFPFERDLFPEGDVARHFLGLVGLGDSGIQIQRTNEVLSATAVKALYCYRRFRAPNDVNIARGASRANFVAALASIRGPSFALHPELEEQIAKANDHILDWSEARLGRRLRPPEPVDGQGPRDEADMMRFDDSELETLAQWAKAQGLHPTGSQNGAEGVADLLASLRSREAGASGKGSGSRPQLKGEVL